MSAFLLAVQFLSVFPLKIKNVTDKKLCLSLIYFPAAGLLLGIVLAGINYGLGILEMNQLSRVIILTVCLIALTGGLHLDGLSDTLDAILSHKNKDEMLAIMRDSNCGVMGVLGVLSAILLKIALLFSLPDRLIPFALMLMCVVSRWGMVWSIFLFPYARSQGKAAAYFSGINVKIFTLATVIALACAIFFAQFNGLIIIVICALIVYLFARSIYKKIGGMTGDTLGALNELAEITILFTIFILERRGLWITG